jgi:hypothetical protein
MDLYFYVIIGGRWRLSEVQPSWKKQIAKCVPWKDILIHDFFLAFSLSLSLSFLAT